MKHITPDQYMEFQEQVNLAAAAVYNIIWDNQFISELSAEFEYLKETYAAKYGEGEEFSEEEGYLIDEVIDPLIKIDFHTMLNDLEVAQHLFEQLQPYLEGKEPEGKEPA